MNVFVGIPTHDGRVETGTFKSVESQKHSLMLIVNASSLLSYNCNYLLSTALNLRIKYSLKWFAMLHSDVIPEMFWIDKLIELAEANGADLLSCVIPIKTDEELTSTAIGDSEGHAKLTRSDALNLPKVFSIDDVCNLELSQHREMMNKSLLVNTGCMIYNLEHWLANGNSDLCFSTDDSLRTKVNGEFSANVFSEDWKFSALVGRTGKVMATTAIQIQHVGRKNYTL